MGTCEPAYLRHRIFPLSLVMGMVFMNFFARTLLSPLLLSIEHEFSLSHAVSSRLFLYITLGYVFSMINSGFVSSVMMHRRTLVFSALVMAAAMAVIGVSQTYFQLSIGFLLVGAGAGLYPSSGLTVLTDMISRRDWQKALVLHDIGPHASMMAVPLIAAALLPLTGWRTLVFITGVLMVLVAWLFGFLMKFGNTRGSSPTYANLLMLFRIPSFWVIVIIYSLAFAGIQGVYLLIPTFLVSEAGFSPGYANTVFGISRGVTIVSLVTAGFFIDRIRLRLIIGLIMGVSGISIVLMGVLSGNALIPVLCLQPALGALFPSAGFRALSLAVPMKLRSLAVSMSLPFGALVGSGLVPAFLGYMGDEYTFALGFIILGIVMLLSSFLVYAIRFQEENR